jgi:hypothetical protein
MDRVGAASLGVGERADPPLRGWSSCVLHTYVLLCCVRERG